jgi:hypothetical protein
MTVGLHLGNTSCRPVRGRLVQVVRVSSRKGLCWHAKARSKIVLCASNDSQSSNGNSSSSSNGVEMSSSHGLIEEAKHPEKN